MVVVVGWGYIIRYLKVIKRRQREIADTDVYKRQDRCPHARMLDADIHHQDRQSLPYHWD